LTILFYHLLHNPDMLAAAIQEIDAQLPSQAEIYAFAGLEGKLPYTLACMRESFRVSPIAAMLLPREVIEREGAEIDGHHIPQGVSHTDGTVL
jgi:benzoate 4-monooxygenase